MADQTTVQPMAQRIAMKAIIVNADNKVLVLREAASYSEGTKVGRYETPGGRLEPGEPFMDGLSREVLEETGLTVTVEGPLQVGEWFPVIKGVPTQIVGVFFLCRAGSGDVRLSEDHDDFQWVDLEAARGLDIISPDGEVVVDYLLTLR